MKPLANPFETPPERVWNTKTETETRNGDIDREEDQTQTKTKTRNPDRAAFRKQSMRKLRNGFGGEEGSPFDSQAACYVALFCSIVFVILSIVGALPYAWRRNQSSSGHQTNPRLESRTKFDKWKYADACPHERQT